VLPNIVSQSMAAISERSSVDRHVMLFEPANDADVGQATRATAAEGDPDGRADRLCARGNDRGWEEEKSGEGQSPGRAHASILGAAPRPLYADSAGTVTAR
jgi:hypothetical protein